MCECVSCVLYGFGCHFAQTTVGLIIRRCWKMCPYFFLIIQCGIPLLCACVWVEFNWWLVVAMCWVVLVTICALLPPEHNNNRDNFSYSATSKAHIRIEQTKQMLPFSIIFVLCACRYYVIIFGGREGNRERVRKTFDYWWCVICHCVRPNNFPRK